MACGQITTLAHTMPDFADDPKTELERKAEQLKWVALIETTTYILLFALEILDNVPATKITGFFHGWIFIVFAVMVVWIWPSMGWRWYWIPLALLTGPVGGILLYEKIRRDGVPANAAKYVDRIVVVRSRTLRLRLRVVGAATSGSGRGSLRRARPCAAGPWSG